MKKKKNSKKCWKKLALNELKGLVNSDQSFSMYINPFIHLLILPNPSFREELFSA